MVSRAASAPPSAAAPAAASAAPTGCRGREADARCGHDDHRDRDRQGAIGGEAQEHVAPVERGGGSSLEASSGRRAHRCARPCRGSRRRRAARALGVAVRRSAQKRATPIARRWACRAVFGVVGSFAERSSRLERSCANVTHDAAHGVQQYGLLAGRSVRGGARGVLGSGPSAGRDLELGFSLRGRAHSSAGFDVAPTLPRAPSARQTRYRPVSTANPAVHRGTGADGRWRWPRMASDISRRDAGRARVRFRGVLAPPQAHATLKGSPSDPRKPPRSRRRSRGVMDGWNGRGSAPSHRGG